MFKKDTDFDVMGDNNYKAVAEKIRSYIERIEEQNARIADATEARSKIYAEAKNSGYCTKAICKIVALRNWRRDEIAEEQAIVELYKSALGM